MRPSGVITLLSDFGLEDPYVGQMKGIILGIHPDARIVDLTHEVAPGDIEQAARVLLESHRFFSPGTVHVAVVDPGVGSRRRPLAAITPRHLLVAPDNGLLWPILVREPEARLIHISNPACFRDEVSRTFHGRDIFAPAAAHLACGLPPEELGPPLENPVRLSLAEVRRRGQALCGVITRVDRFGNLISNVTRQQLEEFLSGSTPVFQVGKWRVVGMHDTYSDVPPGHPVALIGSTATLELAVNQGKASEQPELRGLPLRGMEVVVTRV